MHFGGQHPDVLYQFGMCIIMDHGIAQFFDHGTSQQHKKSVYPICRLCLQRRRTSAPRATIGAGRKMG